MIPGTLRPLPKKLKEVKDVSERLLSIVEYDHQTTSEIYKSSQTFTFEEIRNHHIRLIEHHSTIIPLVKEGDKLADKYSTDQLLRDLTFKLYSRLERNEHRLSQDVKKLDTLLMSRRKDFIEDAIPLIKDEINSKLSFLRNLSFDELLKDSKTYGDTISKIVGKVEILRDEYNKLSDGSFDIGDMYEHLNESLGQIDDDLKEYLLILATCRMEMLTEDSLKIIENGRKIEEKYELEQTTELIEESQEYLSINEGFLNEMKTLKIEIPKKAMKKDFKAKYDALTVKFETNKNHLDEVMSSIGLKTRLLETNIDRITALKEYAASTHSQPIKETAEILFIKKKGTFRFLLKEHSIPHVMLLESGLIQLPNAEELTSDKIDSIVLKLEELDNVNIFKDYMFGFRSTTIGAKIYDGSVKTWQFIKKYAKITWEFIKKYAKKTWEFIKKYAKKMWEFLKEQTKKFVAFIKSKSKKKPETEKGQTDSSESATEGEQ